MNLWVEPGEADEGGRSKSVDGPQAVPLDHYVPIHMLNERIVDKGAQEGWKVERGSSLLRGNRKL
jgi:hypothetical protein